ncbi:MAG: TIGR03087 family PEP-CTERM/XrtA system glycosyltransferase [Rhodocyclaceae bacterium]|nr:TIGR03087 family PEP-CTERM/XrtA system glycosyltransferase [Rhodocyclaceae bacterium]
MARLLYLVHRLPYPPNKGDKVRSFHLLKHLARDHEVHLGTFIDDPADEEYVDTVRGYCAGLHVERLSPRIAKLSSLSGLLSGEALSLPYYRRRGMRDWVAATLAQRPFDAAVVFSSVMAQYVPDTLPCLVDFVDADSAKWTAYAASHRWPMSWIYRREGRMLLKFERQVAARARRSFFVTPAEAALFTKMAPECSASVDAVGNGVDADFFSPQHAGVSPYGEDELPLVFTGAMDYWPNIDAVCWFAAEVLPRLRAVEPRLRFHIVGRSPTPAVLALAGEGVAVSGTVPDVRPWLAHAAVVVAPLRIARGVQNKVLEAMAMGRPVVAARGCANAIEAGQGTDFLTAESADEYVAAIRHLLANAPAAAEVGANGRACVVARYSWDAHLAGIDRHLTQTESGAQPA